MIRSVSECEKGGMREVDSRVRSSHAGLLERIGEDNVHGNIRAALAHARGLVGAPSPA